MHDHRLSRPGALVGAAGLAAALTLAGCSSASQPGSAKSTSTSRTTSAPSSTSASSSGTATTAASGGGGSTSGKTLQIAYLSFAVTNSYDAPMLAAAKKAAAAGNAKLTVFDAKNSPSTQHNQFQDVISSGKYQGVITQPIVSTTLIDLTKQAIAKGIKVVNIDQILGTSLSTANPQVPGLSANVTFVPTEMGTKLGDLTVKACASKHLNPCKVAYLYDVKASSLDGAIHGAFTKATAGSPVKVVAEGQSFFTPTGGLKAVQNILTAHPDINAIAGSDQGIEGAVQAIKSAGDTGKVLLIGYGGSAAGLQGVKAGTWYGTVMQDPAAEGRIGVQDLIKALRTGKSFGAVNPLSSLPDKGVVTKANVSKFTPQWPG